MIRKRAWGMGAATALVVATSASPGAGSARWQLQSTQVSVRGPWARTSGAYATGGSILIRYWLSRNWPTLQPSLDFAGRGRSGTVDCGFTSGIGLAKTRRRTQPWDDSVLGKGRYLKLDTRQDQGVDVYRDRSGTRLVCAEGPHFSCQAVLLSSRCNLPARKLTRPLSSLRTDLGIHLGTGETNVRHLLGRPSRLVQFGRHRLLWYFTPLTRHRDAWGRAYSAGYGAAYAVDRGRVVEILVEIHADERHG